jgi:hypothetical protein
MNAIPEGTQCVPYCIFLLSLDVGLLGLPLNFVNGLTKEAFMNRYLSVPLIRIFSHTRRTQ